MFLYISNFFRNYLFLRSDFVEIQLTAEMSEKVLQNQGLVHHILNNMSISPNDYEDLFQVGTIGLIKATYTYDEEKNIQFSTYAGRCITNEIVMYFRKNNKHSGNLSLNANIADATDDDSLTLLDTFPDLSTSTFTDTIEKREILKRAISIIFNCFPTREMIMLLFSTAGISQKAIATKFELSQSHVSRLRSKLYRKMKIFMNNEKEPTQEIFLVSMRNNKISITFSTTDREIFNNAFIVATNNQKFKNLEIVYSDDKVKMCFTAEPEIFELVAEILYEAKKYGIEFI